MDTLPRTRDASSNETWRAAIPYIITMHVLSSLSAQFGMVRPLSGSRAGT
jgi:hypothetical protein